LLDRAEWVSLGIGRSSQISVITYLHIRPLRYGCTTHPCIPRTRLGGIECMAWDQLVSLNQVGWAGYMRGFSDRAEGEKNDGRMIATVYLI